MFKIEEKTYVPFVHQEALLESLNLQEFLGFGRIRELALPEVRLTDTQLEQQRQANKLAEMFSLVHLPPNHDWDCFYPYDKYLIIEKTAIPIFDTVGDPHCYGSTSRARSFNIRRYWLNPITARDYGLSEIDWTKTPPEWAAIVFPKGSCNYDCLSMEMHEDVKEKIKKENNSKEDLEWICGVPQFPTTALELAKRARGICPDGTFMLIFQPDWRFDRKALPELDPILLLSHEVDRKIMWFKIAEWGMDQSSSLGID